MAQAGQIIADRYRLEAQLGRGAMGRIWRAHHLGLNSSVALKFLDPAIADNPETFNRFVLEAQAAAAVRSAHVVQIFDCGVDESVPYICMELLQGEGLDERLRARVRLTPAELDKVMREVAEAVDNAHALGVIHRDLKPANIFIAREREREIAKVLDFGIAKLIRPDPDRDSAALTSSGVFLGTPHYMSPEQTRGSRQIDQRTDLWALAVIAYECLTGELPFQGGSMGDIIVQICTEEAPLASELVPAPPGFDAWFRRGTMKNPAERFASAGEMARALSHILATPREPTLRLGGARGRARPGAPTLRSEPGARDEAPGSSPPVVCSTSVWLPRTSVRWWLCGGAAAALAGWAFATTLWPNPGRVPSSHGSAGAAPSASSLRSPGPAVLAAQPAPEIPEAAPSAGADSVVRETVAPEPPAPEARQLPAAARASSKRNTPPIAKAPTPKPLPVAPAAPLPRAQRADSVAQESADADPFSERR